MLNLAKQTIRIAINNETKALKVLKHSLRNEHQSKKHSKITCAKAIASEWQQKDNQIAIRRKSIAESQRKFIATDQ